MDTFMTILVSIVDTVFVVLGSVFILGCAISLLIRIWV